MTPMMQQYFEIKNQYKDYLLFYRLGDFYEMFFDDAVLASRELELTLTGRDCGEAERAPMCGVPFHSAEGYIGKLIEKGYKVAICEQTEDPSQAKGIVTCIENHGFFCNGADRVIRMIQASDCPNLKMTLDVGNFLCVDEDPVASVKKCLPYAAIIHFKDFYVRKKDRLPGQTEMFNCNNGSWFETIAGKMLRGSILGQGDIDIPDVVRLIKNSGFDGYLSLEFEGMEECHLGTEISFNMARALFATCN